VGSLPDGMNLVSKEFVAAREDEQGVLVLSAYAGASVELRQALIVNPRDTERLVGSSKTRDPWAELCSALRPCRASREEPQHPPSQCNDDEGDRD
jgi:hypothetical protein